jgi:hypothetical protein
MSVGTVKNWPIKPILFPRYVSHHDKVYCLNEFFPMIMHNHSLRQIGEI